MGSCSCTAASCVPFDERYVGATFCAISWAPASPCDVGFQADQRSSAAWCCLVISTMKPAIEIQNASAKTPYAIRKWCFCSIRPSQPGPGLVAGQVDLGQLQRLPVEQIEHFVAVQLLPLDELVGDALDGLAVRLDEMVCGEVRLAEQLLDHRPLRRI